MAGAALGYLMGSLVALPLMVGYFGIDQYYPGGFTQFLQDGSDRQLEVDKYYGVDNPWLRPRIIPWGVK